MLRAELAVDYKHYAAFDRYCEEPTTKKNRELLLEFEKSRNQISQKDMTLPLSVLPLNLLDSAKLSNHDRQLALIGDDYCQKNPIYTNEKLPA